ncbi:hypothetical protein DdX_03761 [Ditylenchus destructor]|uniref:Uncharacterized protein n=1 Tax=Ditylenchus destructor TaxID=166010 RepID=A0AAD4NFR2_9BILA|nr:hypothetical protein DdX_03761 [Ditylenchus destructor]
MFHIFGAIDALCLMIVFHWLVDMICSVLTFCSAVNVHAQPLSQPRSNPDHDRAVLNFQNGMNLRSRRQMPDHQDSTIGVMAGGRTSQSGKGK